MDKQSKIIFRLRITLFILLIVFWIVFEITTKTHCEACSYVIEGEEYSAEDFFEMYHNKCLVSHNVNLLENFKINNSLG